MDMFNILWNLAIALELSLTLACRSIPDDARSLPYDISDECLLLAVVAFYWDAWYPVRVNINGLDLNHHYHTYYTDACEETGRKGITCEEGFQIKIKDVMCVPRNYTCPEYDSLSRLCNGLRSCSNVDVRRQLVNYCMNYPMKTVYTSFQCVPAKTKPVCRTNVCSGENIRCRRGSVFHLITVKCRYIHQECHSDVFKFIYQTCEGQRLCSLPILRIGIEDDMCKSAARPNNIFMDYICIDESTISSTCSGTFTVQKLPFGILASPGYPGNPDGVSGGCFWAIYANASLGEEAHLIVHEAYSKEGRETCDTQYLQVQYTLCDSKESTTDRFCSDDITNVKIHSCGTIYVSHKPYAEGLDRGSRFLVSYQVAKYRQPLPTYDEYSGQCDRVDRTYMESRFTVAYQQTHSTPPPNKGENQETALSVPPDELPINDSSATDPETVAVDAHTDVDSFDPWKFVTLLRVVVVNIFLGLLILALVMAIAFVCYRYRYLTFNRDKKPQTSKSETVTTLDDKQGTDVQLLSPATKAELNNSVNPSPRSPSETQPLHHTNGTNSPYETTIFHFNRTQVDSEDEIVLCDLDTGVSSFLPHPPLRRSNGKQLNAESAYSSFEEDQETADVGNYSVINDLQLECNHADTCVKPGEQISNVTDCYSQSNGINHHGRQSQHNPEYAVISKVNNQQRKEQNTSDCEHTVFDNRHIHVVPEDTNQCCGTETMHLIPEHHCLLHNIPPPPPPPTSRVIEGDIHNSNNRRSWTAIHAHV